MRASQFHFQTLKEDPSDAEVASHRLMLRAGMVRRLGAGIYTQMPLGLRVVRKVEAIIREEMNRAGAIELSMPMVQPAELWQETGRWDKMGPELLRLKDRHGRDFAVQPTSEEVVTDIARQEIRSWKQLPKNFYQIQTKFRDERRPRFGVMRGREFIMKDAYSFHASSGDLANTYGVMEAAYKRIFARCGVQSIAVDADSGAIGGSASKEFMVTADAGEDLILISADNSYAANQERAESLAPEAEPLLVAEASYLATPGQTSIEALCSAHGFQPSQTVKVLLLVARFSNGTSHALLVSLRGDQQLNEVKLSNALTRAHGSQWGSLLKLQALEASCLADPRLIPMGYVGPDLDDSVLAGSPSLAPKFLRYADSSAAQLNCFVCGANTPNQHLVGARWGTNGIPLPEVLDLRSAQAGDRCCHDPAQVLQATRGIEVGHIFQLGRKYSEALDARFTNEQGEEEALWMGCYGIGVSRLAQAAVEQNHDSAGIIWPVPIAPFEVVLVIASAQDPQQVDLAEGLYGQLLAAGVDALLDDRSERAGVKFKDAELIGIPWRLVVGRGAANGVVELVERCSGDKQEGPASELIDFLLKRLSLQRLGD